MRDLGFRKLSEIRASFFFQMFHLWTFSMSIRRELVNVSVVSPLLLSIKKHTRWKIHLMKFTMFLPHSDFSFLVLIQPVFRFADRRNINWKLSPTSDSEKAVHDFWKYKWTNIICKVSSWIQSNSVLGASGTVEMRCSLLPKRVIVVNHSRHKPSAFSYLVH